MNFWPKSKTPTCRRRSRSCDILNTDGITFTVETNHLNSEVSQQSPPDYQLSRKLAQCRQEDEDMTVVAAEEEATEKAVGAVMGQDAVVVVSLFSG